MDPSAELKETVVGSTQSTGPSSHPRTTDLGLTDSASRCLRDVLADFERQGGLSKDDIYRLVGAHRLAPGDAHVVLVRLGVLGIVIDDDEAEEPAPDDDLRRNAIGNKLGAHRILTAQDEVNLGRRIRIGLEAGESPKHGSSPAAADLIRDGREAHQTLVRSNVRLVISIAKRYVGLGLEMDDLIQEGVLGLMRAADKFDHTLGYKFSTYATWWVRQSIERGIANSARLIRLPVHVVEQVERVVDRRRRMEMVLGREPTLAELSFELQMDIAKISALLDYSRGVVSLDRIVGEDASIADFQAALEISPQELVERQIVREDFDARLRMIGNVMGPKYEDILRRRFGIGIDDEPQTLDSIGEVYGVTRERIRQMQAKALKSECIRDLFSDFNQGWFSDDAN